MSGLTFLFSAALWALPLAGLPLLLHLLFRRKSPVVPFPTLRFVRAAVQQTAARKKVHRWLLLALRILALLLLIYAVSQPALRPADAWASAGKSAAAVIVIDTSYSMQLSDDGATLAGRADQAVRELLNGKLRGMKVAVMTSRSADETHDASDATRVHSTRRDDTLETFRDSGDVVWSSSPPQPAEVPLWDRVQQAAKRLAKEPVDDRWLIVVSDFQSRDFPRAIPESDGVRLVLIDLHPQVQRSAAIASVRLQPEQPTPGIASEIVIDIAGRPLDVRQVNASIRPLDGEGSLALPPAPANLDEAGAARLRMPLVMPPGFVAIDAALTAEEPLAWATSRRLLVQTPPRQVVAVLDPPGLEDVSRRIALAMDPTAGESATWSLSVRQSPTIPADANVAVAVIGAWPSAEVARQWRALAAAGNTVILFLRPGLEETWPSLPQPQRDAIAAILPGLPATGATPASAYSATIAAPASPILRGLADERFQIGSITARRILPVGAIAPDTQTILGLAELTGDGVGERPAGLLFRRAIAGATAGSTGAIYCFATLPDKRFSTLHLHPTFPPMLVQMSQRPPEQSNAQNVEIGSPLTLTGPAYEKFAELRLEGPGGEVTAVKPAVIDGRRQFRFDRATAAGVYTWRNPADDRAVAMTNVQYPAAETDLRYTPADRLVASDGNAVVARSPAELSDKLASLSRPEPTWAIILAAVMVLLCAEAPVAGGWRAGR